MMEFSDYQHQAARTLRGRIDDEANLRVVVLGAVSELGEIASEIKKAVEQDRPVNVAKIQEETGDLCWYVAAIATLLDIDLGECARDNLAKLWRRYPNGFSPEASIARMDKHQE